MQIIGTGVGVDSYASRQDRRLTITSVLVDLKTKSGSTGKGSRLFPDPTDSHTLVVNSRGVVPSLQGCASGQAPPVIDHSLVYFALPGCAPIPGLAGCGAGPVGLVNRNPVHFACAIIRVVPVDRGSSRLPEYRRTGGGRTLSPNVNRDHY